ncbi:Ca(2+)-dependent cysteine protease [Mortierella antarctica]|nr:Ca(2+)-dependent cysteine protease [Mortierella antarctica]
MSDPYADLDIDPAVLADVTRVVQELMKQQQLELALEIEGEIDSEPLEYGEQEEAIHCHDNDSHNHNNDPFGISAVSREVLARDPLEHADRHDFVVSHLSVKSDADNETKEHSEAYSQVSSTLLSSTAESLTSRLTSTSSALGSFASSSTASSTSLTSSSPSQPFSLQDSALKPGSTHLAPPSSSANDGSDVVITLLPGQKTPTRATATVKAPTTDPDGDGHQFFEHAPSKDISFSKTPTSSPTKATTPRYETIPRVIPASASPPTRPRRKKALLIGINYFGDPNQLLGCINDTRDVFGFLNGYYGFRYQDTVMLTDDQIYEDKRPTGANIRYWMKWLIKDAEPQDSLFFHYAGHGGRIKDFSYNGKAEHLGDEADGYDEIIYPSDYLRSGIISDDEMYDLLVKELPTGVQLTALVDACHSGTMLDLPYVYNGNHVTELEKFTRKKVGAMAAMSAEIDFDLPGSTNNVTQTQTQTTTTTMTTTTTVTTTTTNGSTHHSPAGDSDMLKLSQSSAKTNVLVSPGVPEIDFNASKKLVSPGQGNSKRSIGPLDAAEDGEDCTDIEMTGAEVDESVPRLTVTTPQHEGIMSPDQQIPGSASLSSPVTCVSPSSPQAMKDMQRDAPRSPTSSTSLSPSTSSASMSSQSSDPRRKRAKSVHTTEDLTSTATDNNPERGMACDNSAWTQAEEQDNQDTSDPVVDVTTELSVPEASPAPVSVLVTTPASASMFAVPDGLASPDDDIEEAKKMALFRKTKGNVVMFSGCRDDQASADIRASAKDAAIIAHHNKFGPNAVIDHGASAEAHIRAESNSNPLGYSLPQPYTSPMARGAVSYAWIQCLSQKPEQSYEELLSSMRYFMKQRDLDQIPQLGSGVPMDMRTLFTL